MLENLPVLVLNQIVLLPYQELRLELDIELSKNIIDNALNNYDHKLLVVLPNDVNSIKSNINDLPHIGIFTKIKSKLVLPNGNYRVILQGLNRVIIKEYYDNNNLEAVVKRLYIEDDNKTEETAIIRTLKTTLENFMEINPNVSNSVANALKNVDDLDMLTDIVANYMNFDFDKKMKYMNEFDSIKRANELIKDINVELQVVSIESKVEEEIRDSFDKEQRDYIIKQKIKKLNEELGVNVDKQTEVSIYEDKINKLNINDKTKNKLLNEVKKYDYTSESNPDSSGIRNYLDIVTDLPWNISSKDEMDLKKIKKNLDKSHFGLEEVKQRILEFIAVKKNNKNISSPIICLVGPPGTGKTTLGISIAQVLNREFYKISVGGLNDPSELTGHKRTYLGSSPGKIMQGIKKCGTNNPVILIDEVDKIASGHLGDPAAVLLDILDPSQNAHFIDNYIEEPFDLSKVLFILTANDIKSISSVLKDRLEIIEINSYTELEKIDIAKKYLIPNIIKEYNTNKVKITDDELLYIINSYTKEAGVRELDRILKRIYRNIIINDNKIKIIDKNLITKSLGPVKYNIAQKMKTHYGSVSTLGVTPYGGVIISIESLLVPGNGSIIVTGNVEDGIKETTQIAYHYIMSKQDIFGNYVKKMKDNDIHINLLNYSIKKTGTSGSLAITTSILSLLLQKEVNKDVCFTGEVTLHGDICKVGGIKEKIIGAYNNGYKIIFIPEDNKNDLVKVPDEIKNSLEIKCVSNYEEVYNYLFNNKK